MTVAFYITLGVLIVALAMLAAYMMTATPTASSVTLITQDIHDEMIANYLKLIHEGNEPSKTSPQPPQSSEESPSEG